jgi:hypothetical protein
MHLGHALVPKSGPLGRSGRSGPQQIATVHYPISHLQTTGFCIHAALISGRAPEHGRPFSWTQPGGIGGHGVPSGLTHACSGPAYAGIANVNAMPRATTAPPHSSWVYLMDYCLSRRSGHRCQFPGGHDLLVQQSSSVASEAIWQEDLSIPYPRLFAQKCQEPGSNA